MTPLEQDVMRLTHRWLLRGGNATRSGKAAKGKPTCRKNAHDNGSKTERTSKLPGNGKTSRARDRKKMLNFASEAGAEGPRCMAEVGKAHVIRYWKRRRDLSDAVKMQHFYALRHLWQLAGKAGGPPAPKLTSELDQIQGSSKFK